mmetsp:Transcript_35862/g.119920  ORF Transcript_35862/g.119920 Transcript_35862/m.119920 type:complete len:201 (+) Transcript_35862:163-765(+)
MAAMASSRCETAAATAASRRVVPVFRMHRGSSAAGASAGPARLHRSSLSPATRFEEAWSISTRRRLSCSTPSRRPTPPRHTAALARCTTARTSSCSSSARRAGPRWRQSRWCTSKWTRAGAARRASATWTHACATCSSSGTAARSRCGTSAATCAMDQAAAAAAPPPQPPPTAAGAARTQSSSRAATICARTRWCWRCCG